MRLLEKILAFVTLLALTMKFNLISGGDIIALLAMLILASMYYAFGFLFFNQIKLTHIFKKDSYKAVTAPRIILGVVTGLGLSIIVVGALFKLLGFSGANTMLIIGLSVTAIVSVISLTRSLKGIDPSGKFILWRAGVTGFIGIALLATSELSIVKFQYRNHPDYIKAYANYLNNNKSEESYKKVQLERYRIILTDEEFKMYEKSVNRRTPD